MSAPQDFDENPVAMRQRVRCAICGKVTAGNTPRGGTGDYLTPRYHESGPGEACEGVYMEAEWVTDDERKG